MRSAFRSICLVLVLTCCFSCTKTSDPLKPTTAASESTSVASASRPDTRDYKPTYLEQQAAEKQKKLFDAAAIEQAIQVRGRVIRLAPWTEFPDVSKKLLDLNVDAKQLLVISAGSPALLVTTETQFSTTGYFFLNTIKLMATETNLGQVPVLVEFRRYRELKAQYDQALSDIKRLALQNFEKVLPEYMERAKTVKTSTQSMLSESEIASLLMVDEVMSRKDSGDNVIMYSRSMHLALCAVYHAHKLTPSSWSKEYRALFPNKRTSEHPLADETALACANNGPFMYQEHVLTFHDCMCGYVNTDQIGSAEKKEMGRILAALSPEAPGSREVASAPAAKPAKSTSRNKHRRR